MISVMGIVSFGPREGAMEKKTTRSSAKRLPLPVLYHDLLCKNNMAGMVVQKAGTVFWFWFYLSSIIIVILQ